MPPKIRPKTQKKKPEETASSDLADLLFPEQDENAVSDSVLNIPPEQRKLHTETYDFSISTIVEHLDKKHIFIPEFQRAYVWSEPQASRLIESLIIQCPIPVIYLSQTTEEKLSVVDGNQRLTSIRRFIKGEFKLKGLTAYPELEGNYFEDLDTRFQRHIINRTLRCIVILKETHPQVKFDVFERLNTGAVKLNPQELRHGIYYGNLAKKIELLGEDPRWSKLIGATNVKRMKSDELILRFLALRDDLDHYEKPLVHFLNKYLEKKRLMNEVQIENLSKIFLETLDTCEKVFGNLAFRLIDTNGLPTRNFNTAVYDAQMIAINLSIEKIKTLKSADIIILRKEYLKLFLDEKFRASIERATSDPSSVKLRVKKVAKLF